MWKAILVLAMVFSCSLNAEIKVLAFSGSTRGNSANTKLVKEAAEIARKNGATVTLIDLNDYEMPFYDADIEAKNGMPAQAKQLRELMIQSEVILIASPEYNSSLSAVLKNTIDWVSRSEKGSASRDAFKGKKFVIMSASPGAGGGARGLVHLKNILEAIGGTVVSPEFALPNSYTAFDEQGHLENTQKREALEALVRQALTLN